MLSFFPSSLTFLVPIVAFLYSSSTLPLPSPPHLFPTPPPHASLQMEELLLPAVDLEQWYQELMAGLGTGPAAASPRSSPPPLPAKASRQLQVTPYLTAHPSPSPAPLCPGHLLSVQQPHSTTGDGGSQLSQGSRGASGLRDSLMGSHPSTLSS